MKSPVKDSQKLETLADWFDKQDEKDGNENDEVQQDLRRIAETIFLLELEGNWPAS